MRARAQTHELFCMQKVFGLREHAVQVLHTSVGIWCRAEHAVQDSAPYVSRHLVPCTIVSIL